MRARRWSGSAAGKLLRDAFMRLRFADGFSHARSMAFATSLVLVQGLIAHRRLRRGGQRRQHRPIGGARDPQRGARARATASSPTRSRRRTPTARRRVGSRSCSAPSARSISGSTLFGQLERGLNRIYGVEQDRPTRAEVRPGAAPHRHRRRVFGGRVRGVRLRPGDRLRSWARKRARSWDIARWPLALALIVAAMALLFRWSPRRRQPAWSWLAYGSALSVLLWSASTLALGSDVPSQHVVR